MDEELVHCAQANFENLEKAMPVLKQHPYYLIAKAQLDEALGGKTVEESLSPHIPESGKIRPGYMGDINGAGCDPDVP